MSQEKRPKNDVAGSLLQSFSIMLESEQRLAAADEQSRAHHLLKRLGAPKRILVGTDFSPPSIAAFNYAVTLAKALGVGASIHVVHGVQLPILGMPDGTLGISADVLSSRIMEEAERLMNGLTKKHEKTNASIPLTTSIETGDPRDSVMAVAEREGADIIVLGTHGRHGLARALIGSIAEAVIRRSTLPVVTVHAQLTDLEFEPNSQQNQDYP